MVNRMHLKLLKMGRPRGTPGEHSIGKRTRTLVGPTSRE